MSKCQKVTMKRKRAPNDNERKTPCTFCHCSQCQRINGKSGVKVSTRTAATHKALYPDPLEPGLYANSFLLRNQQITSLLQIQQGHLVIDDEANDIDIEHNIDIIDDNHFEPKQRQQQQQHCQFHEAAPTEVAAANDYDSNSEMDHKHSNRNALDHLIHDQNSNACNNDSNCIDGQGQAPVLDKKQVDYDSDNDDQLPLPRIDEEEQEDEKEWSAEEELSEGEEAEEEKQAEYKQAPLLIAAAEEDVRRNKKLGRPRLAMPDLDAKLFEGSDKKLGEQLVELLQFSTATGMSRNDHINLMKMFKSTLPHPNSLIDEKTWRRVLKWQAMVKSVRVDLCINGCIAYTDQYSELTSCIRCKEERYENSDRCINGCCRFVGDLAKADKCNICQANRYENKKSLRQCDIIPIESHLRRLFKQPATSRHMKLRTEARTPNKPLSDLYASEAWQQRVVNSGFAANYPKGAVLHLSADGTNPFAFNSHSIWPIYIEILNLPLSIRRQYGNLCLLALIHGPKAPSSLQGPLEVIAKQLKQLHDTPIIVYDSDTQRNIRISAILHSVTADLPGIDN
jgi:hypothetical protein